MPLRLERFCSRGSKAQRRKVLFPPFVIGLNALSLRLRKNSPNSDPQARKAFLAGSCKTPKRKSLVRTRMQSRLPFDAPATDSGTGLRRWVRDQTGWSWVCRAALQFRRQEPDPSEGEGGPRVVSVAYLALVREGKPSGTAGADWRRLVFVFSCGGLAFRPARYEKDIARLSTMDQAGADARSAGKERERKRHKLSASWGSLGTGTRAGPYELIYESTLPSRLT